MIDSIIKVDDVELRNEQKEPPEPVVVQDEIRFRYVNDFLTYEKEVYIRDGSNAKNYPVFYLATAPCFLIEARLRHDVNGGSGATVDIEKLTNGIAKGSGVSMLASKFDISAGARSVQVKGVSTILSGYTLVPGDAVALKATGTLTNASNITVGILMGIQAKNLPTGQSTTVILVGV